MDSVISILMSRVIETADGWSRDCLFQTVWSVSGEYFSREYLILVCGPRPTNLDCNISPVTSDVYWHILYFTFSCL